LTFLVALGLALRLGSAPLIDADEGRNAEVGREMAATNDYVLPKLDGLPYLDKPIVYFAAEAAVMEVLGPTEVAARLPAYLFTLATALLMFLFARRVWDEERAWVAAIVFLAMPLTMVFARTVIFDSALTFFIAAAIMAFYLAVESPHPALRFAQGHPLPQAGEGARDDFGRDGAGDDPGRDPSPASRERVADGRVRAAPWAALAWIAIGFGIITKGPVAILLPLLVAIPYAIRRKRFRALWSLIGLIGCVVVVAPWVWGVSRQVPDFLRYVVVTETAARIATKELQRTGPPWYFLPFLIGGAMPWVVVLASSWRELRKRDPLLLYLALWILVPLAFFSISQSKRPQYILPLMPPIAFLVAAAWQNIRMRAAAIALACFGLILFAGPWLPVFRKMKPMLIEPATSSAIALGAAFVIGGIVAFIAKRKELALGGLAIAMAALPVLTDPVHRAVGEQRSAKAFITALRPHLQPDSEIVGLEAFTGSMAFYLGRPFTLVSSDGSELTSNYILRHYDRYATDPRSMLKPLPWLDPKLRAPGRTVVITRIKDADFRALVESHGFSAIARGADHVAYARP
jgi:4-amino-4-deoxy-L-arabinose transferase-like glycosyltransferase